MNLSLVEFQIAQEDEMMALEQMLFGGGHLPVSHPKNMTVF